jgi:hypothetical protein
MTSSVVQYINSEEVTPTGMSALVEKLTSGAGMIWETETLLEHLEEAGATLSEAEREGLLAANALRLNPAYLWDLGVFQNMCFAFNGEVSNRDTLSEPSVGQICWAVEQAKFLRTVFKDSSLPEEYYGNGPKRFVAAALISQGFGVIPKELEFAREEFNSLPGASRLEGLEEAVTAKKEKTNDVASLSDSDLVEAQVLKLLAVEHYLSENKKALYRDLKFVESIDP